MVQKGLETRNDISHYPLYDFGGSRFMNSMFYRILNLKLMILSTGEPFTLIIGTHNRVDKVLVSGPPLSQRYQPGLGSL